MGIILPASIVREVGSGERLKDLIAELASLTFTTGGLEHAVIVLHSGQRLIVKGGPGGMDLSAYGGGLRGVVIHTHPFPTGPSDDDFEMLELLNQRGSWLYELFGGGLMKFLRKEKWH